MATIPVMQTTSVSHNSRGGVGMFSKFGKMTTYFHSCFTPRREILKHTPAESFEQKAQKLLDAKLLHKTTMVKKDTPRKAAASVSTRRKLLSVTDSLSRSAVALHEASSLEDHRYDSAKPFNFHAVNRAHFYKHEVAEKQQIPGVGHYKPNLNSLIPHSYRAKITDETVPEKERALQIRAAKAAVPVKFSHKLEKVLSESIDAKLRTTSPKQRHLQYLKTTLLKQKKNLTAKTTGEMSQSLIDVPHDISQDSPQATRTRQSLFAPGDKQTAGNTTQVSQANLSPNASTKHTLRNQEFRAKTSSVAKGAPNSLYKEALGLSRIKSLTLKGRVASPEETVVDLSSYSFRLKKRFPRHFLVKEKDKSEAIMSTLSPDKARSHTPRAFIGELRARAPFVSERDPPHEGRFDNFERLPFALSKRKHVRCFEMTKLTPRQKELFGEVGEQPEYEPNKEFVLPKRVVGILGFKDITRRLPQKSIYKDAYQCESISYDNVLHGLEKEAHRREKVSSPRFATVPGRDGKALA